MCGPRISDLAAGWPTRRDQGRQRRRPSPGAGDLDVAVARVAPGKRSTFEWKRLDHLMATRASVGGVVSPLGLAATDVPALRAHAEVERTATFFAVLCTRLGSLL